jgi:hypothetical protein
MQLWEHKMAMQFLSEDGQKRWEERHPGFEFGGTFDEDWYGNNGWELVSTNSFLMYDLILCFYKRPKQVESQAVE